MKKFRNPQETKKVGANIKRIRQSAGISVPAVAFMTGFKRQTIESIEKGAEVTLSYIIEIAKAINVHPKELLDVPFDKKPRFKLGPDWQERDNLTSRIRDLINESDFFHAPKFVREVEEYLKELSKIKDKSIRISTVLSRFEKEGLLQSKKIGRQKQYSAVKKVGKKK